MPPLLGNRAAFDTNSLDDTKDSSNPAQDVFNQFSGTVSSISTAAIVGIVVVVVAVIVLAILTFWLLRRKQRQRQQRRNMEEQHKTTPGIAAGGPVHTGNNQHLSPGVPDYYTRHEMEQYGGHNPWPNTSGAAVVPSPRFEAQDTGLREAPGTAASPQYQGSSAPQPELHGIESRRQELP
ncbi:hypothetical protein NUW58_g7896 [Xylaria curta]|uniref:Uncharacterized protein n=1 Tax=Xylaria curta TaxID=42375 RepID=A0ACC1NFF3_9PEZI|nr:hypothetical protein NUW58_g7896 [Xylaria curta]